MRISWIMLTAWALVNSLGADDGWGDGGPVAVELHVGGQTRRLGAAAYTEGNRIYLSPDVRATRIEWLTILGHELAHVAQQRQGRVPATRLIAGQPLNDNAALEREADEWGQRFARGDWSPHWAPRSLASATRSPALMKPTERVIQRSVTIAGRPLQRFQDLSAAAQAVLALTDHGTDWLFWAIRSRIGFAFASERDLMVGVQRGLHGDPLLLIPSLGLRVHPERLLQMDPNQLAALHDGEAERILAQQGFLTQSDFSIVAGFLAEVGLTNAPIFQSLSLADQIALTNFLRTSPVAIPTESAAFAVSHAQTAAEFLDYVQFYGAVTSTQGTVDARMRTAETSLELVLPTIWGYLNGPSLSATPPTPGSVQETIEMWASTGNILGFPRLSNAAMQLAQAGVLQGPNDSQIQQRAQQYLTQAQTFILQQGPGVITISQTGDSAVCAYRAGSASATVQVDATGLISLAGFHPQ